MKLRLSKPPINPNSWSLLKKNFSNGYLVEGKYTNLFEEKIKKYLNINNAIMTSSGTAALHLSLVALGIKKNDEVIIPSFSYIATANVVELVGATPIFIDINKDNICIDVDKIENKISKKTKAIIVVHEFGNPADISSILKIAKKYKLKIIEDSACALGSSVNGKKLGTFGDIGCFSFHPRKLISTGEGGLIVTKNKKIASYIKSLKNHGIEKKDNSINFNFAGFNYRITDFQAFIGLEQLKKISAIIFYNKKIANLYIKYLKQVDWITLPKFSKNEITNYQSFHLVIDKKINRDKLIDFLKKNQIESSVGAQCIPFQNYYKKKYNLNKKNYENSLLIYKQGIVLPIGLHISEKDIIKICKIIKKYI